MTGQASRYQEDLPDTGTTLLATHVANYMLHLLGRDSSDRRHMAEVPVVLFGTIFNREVERHVRVVGPSISVMHKWWPPVRPAGTGTMTGQAFTLVNTFTQPDVSYHLLFRQMELRLDLIWRGLVTRSQH